MKNLITNILLGLALVLSSCSEEEQPQFATISTMTFITVLDQKGNNLLDPNQEDAYDQKEIKTFYERDGKMEEFFAAHLDMPRNFRIDPPMYGKDYLMAVALDSEKTVIKWNKTESDTIQAEFLDNKDQAIFVSKVYFKGELKYDAQSTMNRREFTIIKDR